DADVLHEGRPVLRVVKTYRLSPGSYDLKMWLEIQNLTNRAIPVAITQNGPINLRHEASAGGRGGAQYDGRGIVAGIDSGGDVTAVPHNRPQVLKSEDRRVDLGLAKTLRWVAHVNKWFGVIMTPEMSQSGAPAGLKLVKTTAATRTADDTLPED